MKRFIFSLFLVAGMYVSSSELSNAQIGSADHQMLMSLGDRVGNATGNLLYTRMGSYYGVQGTPYLSDNWINGTVYDNKGQKHENTPLLYNAHYDLVEAVVGRDTLILDSRLITRVEFPLTDENGTRNVVLKTGFSNSKEKIEPHNFFEVLNDGKEFTVFKKHYKFLKKSDFDASYNSGSKFDEFRYQGTLFVRKANGDVEKVRTNKRGILGLFGSKSKDVESFINKEKLKYNVDADLARIFAYYDSL